MNRDQQLFVFVELRTRISCAFPRPELTAIVPAGTGDAISSSLTPIGSERTRSIGYTGVNQSPCGISR